jgi:hypothetical protein
MGNANESFSALTRHPQDHSLGCLFTVEVPYSLYSPGTSYDICESKNYRFKKIVHEIAATNL